ncbi:hypothetical protein RV134_320198 [Roseovarius sp. EC-HK134]|nr:hypothetical protein RV420_380127 [Roseovarius sp. EC-SD190]VVT23897.1 hypothetical protein RV134_320198 [Roseovarius sp. EC-HK134]
MRHTALQRVFDRVFEFQSKCVWASFVWFDALALERGGGSALCGAKGGAGYTTSLPSRDLIGVWPN